MPNLPRGLEAKPVFDWSRRPIGTVLGSEVDPRTHDPTSLIIGLNEDVQTRLGTEQSTISLPFDLVFGIRRDEVRLSRDLSDLLPTFVQIEPTLEQDRIVELAASP